MAYVTKEGIRRKDVLLPRDRMLSTDPERPCF